MQGEQAQAAEEAPKTWGQRLLGNFIFRSSSKAPKESSAGRSPGISCTIPSFVGGSLLGLYAFNTWHMSIDPSVSQPVSQWELIFVMNKGCVGQLRPVELDAYFHARNKFMSKLVLLNSCMRAFQQDGTLQAFVYMSEQNICLYLLLCPNAHTAFNP